MHNLKSEAVSSCTQNAFIISNTVAKVDKINIFDTELLKMELEFCFFISDYVYT